MVGEAQGVRVDGVGRSSKPPTGRETGPCALVSFHSEAAVGWDLCGPDEDPLFLVRFINETIPSPLGAYS